MQNVASSDPQSGRISVNSYDAEERPSFVQAIVLMRPDDSCGGLG